LVSLGVAIPLIVTDAIKELRQMANYIYDLPIYKRMILYLNTKLEKPPLKIGAGFEKRVFRVLSLSRPSI
jgi:hypothetical protein